ncbi:MAG: bifunctional phosphoribosylaminoimidazolecarboxamide formyltransferase/IMP cyclohydrolase [Candidatus Nanopelagicaceae bacterium]
MIKPEAISRKAIRKALISVYDKSRLIEIASALSRYGVEIVATGSTCKTLTDSGIKAVEVSQYTGFPEIMDGRVKTLHPKIHAGILADQNNPEHLVKIEELNISPFDLVIVNLYPFTETIASDASFEESIEQIDIGGPSILRGAAKNYESIAAISTPGQYDLLLEALTAGGFTLTERKQLAIEVFRITAEYDANIAMWLGDDGGFHQWMAHIWKKSADLRYGENPHQLGVVYAAETPGVIGAEQLNGKAMSYNNYIDADAALRAALDHKEPAVAIIKHTNPCGIAIGKDISSAYIAANKCDPASAFGGVVAANRTITEAMAKLLIEVFTEVVIAPDYEDSALEILKGKTNLRILKTDLKNYGPVEGRLLSGGLLLQTIDLIDTEGDDSKNWQQVAGKEVSSEVLSDLRFAWRAVRSVKSNAILLAKNGASVGIGMGQVSRMDSAKLAVNRAGDRASGSVAASDAFFPFSDGLQILIDAGVSAVVSPGGSIRDEEVIAAANNAGLPLFFTGTRHFSHA